MSKKKINKRLDKLFDEFKKDDPDIQAEILEVTPSKKSKRTHKQEEAQPAQDHEQPLPEIEIGKAIERVYEVEELDEALPKSILATAFRTEDSGWATLKVEDETEERAWGKEEQLLIKQVADQLSLALENARLFRETRIRAEELAVLNDLARTLSAQLSIQQVLEQTYHGVSRLLDARNFFIGLYQPEKYEIIYPLNVTESKIDKEISSVPAGEGISGYILRTKEPLLIESNMQDWLLQHEIEPLGELADSFLGVPLMIGDQFLGLMAVQDYKRPNAYDLHARDVLTAFASQAAIAIQNARLFEEISRRNEELSALNRIFSSAGQLLEIKELIDDILVQVLDLLGFNSGLVSLFDEKSQTLELVSTYNLPEPVYQSIQKKGLSGSLCDTVYQSFQTLEIEDFRKGAPVDVTGLIENGLLAYFGLAIELRGRKIGTLCVFNDQPTKLDEKHIDLARTVGIQIGFTIENARLFQETKQSESEFRALFAAMEDVVIVYDREGCYVRIAETNPDYLLKPSEEMLGKNLTEVLPESLHKPFLEVIENTLDTGQSHKIEYPLLINDEEFWFEANASKLNEDEVFWVARDITERKKTEEDLARFKLGIDQSGSAIFVTDIEGAIQYVNPAFEHIYGYSAAEAIGNTPRLIKSGLIPQEQYKQFWDTLLSKETVSGEITNKTKDGRLIPISGTNAPIMDVDGELLGFLAIHTDISDTKRNEEALQRRNEYLSAAAEIGRLVTSTLDLDAIFSRAVDLVVERFGYYHAAIFIVDESGFNAVLQEATSLAGSKMKERRHSLAVGSKSIVGRTTESGEVVIINNTALDPIHKPNPLLPETQAEAAIPLRIGSRIIGALDIQSTEVNAFTDDDIAVLQLLTDQIAVGIDNARSYGIAQQAVEDMREVDRLKSQFLANMSHELRTPLNSIIGFARVILKGIDGPVTDLQQQDLTAIFNSGQHLLGLINDILDLSRIEAGKMDLTFDEVNISDLISSVMSTATGLIKDKSIQLKKEIDPKLPLVKADAMRIRQILINLLSNAAKFTDEGEIIVKAEVEHNAKVPSVMISVTDTGPGIAQEDQIKLFQPFSQVDASLTRKAGGSGLGLSICHHLVQMHNGQIGLHSVLGKGSTFYFTIPIYQQPVILSTSDSRTILAIDDDPHILALYERYLQPKGYQVVGLSDPSKAAERVATIRPIAITLDILMPGYDGWQVLSELKSNPETSEIPVIICSILDEEEKGFNLGATDYLIKPINEDELMAAIQRLNSDGRIREVLVIDDDPNDLRLMGKMLANQGMFKPILVEGGPAGWKTITSSTPHIIILDLFMPELNGFTILEKLHDDPTLREVPVIVISSAELTAEQEDQLKEFSDRILHKGSFKENDLITAIETTLARVQKNK